MSAPIIDRIEAGVERLLASLAAERKKAKDWAIKAAELEARLARPSTEIEALRIENERLRRNATVAAEKIESLMKRLSS
jgi:FtsZ-binding cell division protein ZapB